MVSPIYGLHTWVFYLLALELAMLSVMAVGVLFSIAHTRPWSVSPCTHSHNYLSASKHATLWSRQLAHITAVGYITSICSFSLLTTSESFFLPHCRLPASLSCQIQAKASDLLKTLFYRGILRRPPLADSEITQWLWETQYCMTAFSTWGTYNHVSLIQLEWSLISSIEELKIYVKLIT